MIKNSIIWEKRYQEWKASGINISKWCRENEIPLSSFSYWKRKFEKRSLDKQINPTTKPSFIELSDNSNIYSGISITVKGMTLNLSKSFDQQTFYDCLQVLGRFSC